MPTRPPPASSDTRSITQSDQAVYLHFDGYDRGPPWPVADYGEQGIFTAEQQLEIASTHGLSPDLVSRLSLYVGNTLDTESMMNLNHVSRDKAEKVANADLRRAIRHARQDVRTRERLAKVLLGCSALFAETHAAAALLCHAQTLARDPECALTDLLKAADAVLACPGAAVILAPSDRRKVHDARREHIVRSCCYVWLDAERPLTYAMDKGRRQGPLFELIWMVMRLILSEGQRPSDDAIRRDIDRFRELVKRRPEILDHR
jgi:hypothetical protein